MNAQAATLQLPSSLYDLLRQRTQETRRSLEAEIVDVVASVVRPVAPEQSATLRDLIETIREGPRPDSDFGEDLRKIQAEQPPLGVGPWDS